MAALTSLYSLVRPWVPSALDPAIELVTRQVVRDFCYQTRAVQVWLDPITVTAGGGTVSLVAPTGYEIVMPVQVKLDGRTLKGKTADELDHYHPYDDWRELPAGVTQGYAADTLDATALSLVPPTEFDATVRVKVAVRPVGAFTTFPDQLIRWDIQLAHGVRAGLFAMKDTPYYSPEQVAVEEARYLNGVAAARFDVERGMTDTPARVQMTPLA